MAELQGVYEVPVMFHGTVRVVIPGSVPHARAKRLAEKVALARVLATLDNPDAPEDDACNEYEDEFDLSPEQAETDWDVCKTVSVGGGWELAEDENAVQCDA